MNREKSDNIFEKYLGAVVGLGCVMIFFAIIFAVIVALIKLIF